jgi:hypothetical protein
MEKLPDLEFLKILENIRSHFDFLFQRGYRMVSAMFTDPCNENWSVVLATDNCLVKIHYRDKKIHLALSSIQLFGKIGLFDLHELIHLMSVEEQPLYAHRVPLPNVSEQLRKTAWLLEKHMDDILILFQRIHLGISFSRAGQLFKDNSPVFLFHEVDGATRHRKSMTHVAST